MSRARKRFIEKRVENGERRVASGEWRIAISASLCYSLFAIRSNLLHHRGRVGQRRLRERPGGRDRGRHTLPPARCVAELCKECDGIAGQKIDRARAARPRL